MGLVLMTTFMGILTGMYDELKNNQVRSFLTNLILNYVTPRDFCLNAHTLHRTQPPHAEATNLLAHTTRAPHTFNYSGSR